MNKYNNFNLYYQIKNRTIILLLLSYALSIIFNCGLKNAAGQEITIQNFKTQEKDEAGVTRWYLSGKKATIKEPHIEINSFNIRLFQEGSSKTVEVSSPHCSFNRTSNIGRSTEKIIATGENMFLEGKGYDLLLKQQVMELRSEVRMVITHGDNPPFPEPSQKNQDRESRLNEE